MVFRILTKCDVIGSVKEAFYWNENDACVASTQNSFDFCFKLIWKQIVFTRETLIRSNNNGLRL